MTPEGWCDATVVDVVDPARRVTYGIVQPGPRQAEGVRIIRGKDYSSGRVSDADLYRVLPEIAAKYSRSLVKGGDILLSIVGYLGLVAMVPQQLSGANITQTTARIAIAAHLVPHYFLHYFQSPGFRREIERFTKGSAQAGLNLRDIEKMRVLVPPVPEQRKIAAILSSVDDTIEATQAVIDQLVVVKQAMMAEFLTRGLGRHTNFKATEIGEVPESWQVVFFESILAASDALSYGILQPGNNDPSGIPMLRTVDLDEHGGRSDTTVLRVSREIEAAYERTRLRGGEVLLSVMGTVGRAAVAPPEWQGWNVNRALAVVRVNDRVAPEFLSFWLRSPATQQRFSTEQIGSAQKRINLGDLREMLVPVPPSEEQGEICDVLSVIEERLASELCFLTGLRQAKSALMSVLLTGEVRVKPDEAAQ